jgi:Zn ribbon nucleic-acid-binding protein
MSKRIEAKITCPNCSNQFDFTLYRSIWGEYPENRELVMTNQINVASCPSCNHATKLQYPFIYTNANQHFAVWWEPEYDAQIDSDSAKDMQKCWVKGTTLLLLQESRAGASLKIQF